MNKQTQIEMFKAPNYSSWCEQVLCLKDLSAYISYRSGKHHLISYSQGSDTECSA